MLLVSAYVIHSLAVNYVSDDGFIAFEYVNHLVRGEGLVYNPGERVEGYNNFLWIVMLAGFQWLLPKASLLHIAQFLGIFFGAVSIVWACYFSRLMHGRYSIFGLLAAAFIAAHAGLAAWASGGLETTFFAFLLLAAASSYALYLQTGKNLLLTPILFALAALTRPDGMLLFGVTTLHALIVQRNRTKRLLNRKIIAWVLVFTAIYLPYYIWRYTYYGYPMPNTYYAKVGSGLAQYIRGTLYVWDYLKWYGVFVFIPPLLMLLRKKREAWKDYFALLVIAHGLYVIYVGGDGLGFHRFMVYTAPLAYILVQEGMIDLYNRFSGWRFLPAAWMRPALASAALLVCLAFTVRASLLPIVFPKRERWYEPQSQLYFPGAGGNHSYTWFEPYFVDRLAAAAKWLDANAPPGSLVASTPAGSIAYYMDLKVLDMLGLTDIHIARAPVTGLGGGRAGHERGDGKYVLSRSPDFILMGNVAVLPYPLDEATMAKKLVLKSEREIWQDPEFHKNYELQCVQLADSGLFQYFSFYKKKGLVLTSHQKGKSESANGGT
jgi:hypothetical protein